MMKDIRNSVLYQEAQLLYQTLRAPGAGLISDASEVSTDGTIAVFAGTMVDGSEGTPPTRICSVDLATGKTQVLTFGPHVDRLPKFSPDGSIIAFLSDRQSAGDFKLYLLDPKSGAVRATPSVPGWAEYLHWSSDGERILLGVAAHGADRAGAQGAIPSAQRPDDSPTWMPAVATADQGHRGRRAWLYEVAEHTVRAVGDESENVWEAVWCGNQAIAAVMSGGPSEGLWYQAHLHLIDIKTGESLELYAPRDQLGCPAASPSGARLAFVEAVCSDRGIVAGDLKLTDIASGITHTVDTRDVDVAYTEWRSERHLMLAGHRGLETVISLYDADSDTVREVWTSESITTGGRHVTVSGCAQAGDCVLVGEGFDRAPQIAVIRSCVYHPVKSFDLGYAAQMQELAQAQRTSWRAPDGIECQGWLLLPGTPGPHPLVMSVHGGPVWQWRPMWLGRSGVPLLMLLKRGFAVFLPNPRGSTGRGQDFARRVVGDMGGADTQDYLSGLDHLIERGIADPKRLGVIGGSYGGFMASWLVTQDTRFAAAIAVAPVTNHVTEHLLSNIPQFSALFLADTYNNPQGRYFDRSPVMHAHKVWTPTLNICGALDRCTPPEEATQFHNALLENGVNSVLVTYPEEGHGIRHWPAVIDYAARVVDWFEQHMSARDHAS